MKVLKILISVLLLISVGIFIGIFYVWKYIAFAPQTLGQRVVTENEASTTSEVGDVGAENSTSTSSPSAGPPLLEKPVTISTSNLNESQRSILNTLGVGERTITITPRTVECAVDALGEARTRALKEGATPTMSESLTLLACLKK
jgi:hypothetical protein